MPREKFRFLTVEEFNRLSRDRKIAYLEQATEALKRIWPRTGALFRETPPRKKK